jgi:hypothetical protein
MIDVRKAIGRQIETRYGKRQIKNAPIFEKGMPLRTRSAILTISPVKKKMVRIASPAKKLTRIIFVI